MTDRDPARLAGLDEPLPPGERILWQARPGALAMARSAFHLRGVALYCVLAAVAAAIAAHRTGYGAGQSLAAATLLLPLAAAVSGILLVLSRMTARATTYTLTNRRIILHIGIAYEMTVCVPLSAVRGARLRRGRGTTGDIALAVADTGGARYVGLWPHVRPWRVLRPQPMLRALPDVEQAAALIADALTEFNAGGRYPRRAPAPPTAAAPPLEAVAA